MNPNDEQKPVTLYCFTPLVTLITCGIEAGLAIIALLKYRKTRFGQLSILLFVFLSLFQLSEYLICKGGDPVLWHKIGWVSITFLPIISLALVDLLAGKSVWTKIGFVCMIIFAGMAAFVPGVTISATCQGKFILFSQSSLYQLFYGTYYVFFMTVGVVRLLQDIIRKRHHPAAPWFLAGSLSFMLPTLFIYAFVAITHAAVPSILCGFAVILSLILIAKVLPLYHAKLKQ